MYTPVMSICHDKMQGKARKLAGIPSNKNLDNKRTVPDGGLNLSILNKQAAYTINHITRQNMKI